MQDRNPYAAPRATVAAAELDEDYGEIRVFTARGRLGRVRYIGYSLGLTFLFSAVLGIAAGLAGPAVALPVTIVGYIAIFFVSLLLTIQRAHDFNSSGWLSLLMFVPLANLIFLIIPGTDGENRFGKQPPPNTVGAIIAACLLPLIVILGIAAAIAIPAYQDYVQRAQAAQSQSE
jgi:uncharacterized membrane protein YhaH (DUF805 family)